MKKGVIETKPINCMKLYCELFIVQLERISSKPTIKFCFYTLQILLQQLLCISIQGAMPMVNGFLRWQR